MVTNVATQLMGADFSTAPTTYVAMLRDLVNSFELDIAFLRHTDFVDRTTVLTAEWPPRTDIADPDPLHTVAFEGADSVFAAAETLDEILVIEADDDIAGYRETLAAASSFVSGTLVAVPMTEGGSTVGVLGFGSLARRRWSDSELDTLRAIAALATQTHARVVAENRVRTLAATDEQTGLANRRALLEHLRARLLDHTSGPIAVLFLDLGQLKALNDFLGYLAGDEYIADVADSLRRDMGSTALIARLGGDEFVIVDSVIGLAAAFGLDVIAEGVETVDAARVLLARGCTRAQGYLISRPVPAAQAFILLRGGTIDLHLPC